MRLETVGQGHIIKYNYYKQPFTEITSFDEVYQLAADMGGAGYIFTGENDANVMHNSAVINLNVAYYASKSNVKKFFIPRLLVCIQNITKKTLTTQIAKSHQHIPQTPIANTGGKNYLVKDYI